MLIAGNKFTATVMDFHTYFADFGREEVAIVWPVNDNLSEFVF